MKKRTIVLVDDDIHLLDSLGRVLWNEEYTLVKCKNAIEAWNFINEQNGDIDVIISDNKMPHCKGVNLLVAIRKKYPNIVRIMLTGQSELEDAKKAINEGRVYQFLTKPCDPDELVGIVKNALAMRDLFFENKKLLKQVKKRKACSEENVGIDGLNTDDEGRIIINENDYISIDDFMQRYIKKVPV